MMRLAGERSSRLISRASRRTARGRWRDTGDIVAIDADGFVTIKGRANRFARVAGEMVSLSALEAIVASVWPHAQNAVAAIPDLRKGERIVLLTSEVAPARLALLEHPRAMGATELSVPSVMRTVERLPLLGKGQIDYVGAREMAKAMTAPLAA